jgi:peptidoglycan/LPS O-acetylase OafA/YrhL
VTAGTPSSAASDQSIGATDRASAESKRKSPKAGFRPDVEGLRAVAVVAVLLYHGGLSFVPGGYVGVDVFFVISGFLITRLLLKELEQSGTLSIMRFYSRRAKRLLPMTVVVLGTVVVVSWLLFSPVRMDEVSFDVMAAGLYVMNWRLAVQATDYFGAGLQASPVQHFWTLGVEEQFYLIWPALLLAVAWWCRRTRWSLRPALEVALTVVAISSLAHSVYSTEHEAGAAYFSTLTRGWELALGGMLALVPASWLHLPRLRAFALATAGLVAIVWSTIRFSDNTLFPGYAALLPTLGTAAIIAAGFASTSAMPMRLLTLAPVRHVGRVSYSWYLWHWPPLVFAAALWGKLSALEGLAVLAASYVRAVLTHRWIAGW